MDKQYRYYQEHLLQQLKESLVEVPSKYTTFYGEEVMSVEFKTLKEIMGFGKSKSPKNSYTEIERVGDDLGRMLNRDIRVSVHKKWVWFNFLETFVAYQEDIRKEQGEMRQPITMEKKDTLDESILKGVYGIDNPEELGGVYLIRCGDYYKIGYSKDVKARLSALRTNNPYEVELVTKYTPYKVNNKMFETHLHKVFDEYKHRNEWFRAEFSKEDFVNSCVEYYKQIINR